MRGCPPTDVPRLLADGESLCRREAAGGLGLLVPLRVQPRLVQLLQQRCEEFLDLVQETTVSPAEPYQYSLYRCSRYTLRYCRC